MSQQLTLAALMPTNHRPVESRDAAIGELKWRATIPPDREFLDSIRTLGIMEPVLVAKPGPLFPDDPTLIVFEGNRRVAAATILELPTVPVRVFETDAALSHLAIALNENRSSNALAELDAIMDLSRLGANERTIAQATGMAIGTIRKRLRLAKLTPGLRHAVEQGRISISVATAAVKLNEDQQLRLVSLLFEQNKLALRDVDAIKRARKSSAVAALPPQLFAGWGEQTDKDPADRTIDDIAEIVADLDAIDDPMRALVEIRARIGAFLI